MHWGTSRAEPVLRSNPVRPRTLGHVVLGSVELQASEKFFIQGVGFKVSDRVPDAASFLRCSADHHNLLVQAAPIPFLHHSSWQVDDVDEIGRGAHGQQPAGQGCRQRGKTPGGPAR